MAAFASDRDLLVHEPNLFRDVGWVGQRLVKGVGSVSGTALTMSSQDVQFDAAGVDAGHVVVVGGAAYEVTARTSGTVLAISRIRDDTGGPVLPPSAATAQDVWVATFAPQIGVTHRGILRTAGIEPDDPVATVTEAAVVNGGALTRLECLGALAAIWSAAGVLAGDSSPALQRAADYQRRFDAERRRVGVKLDLDGDGVVDATRSLNTVVVERG